MLITVIEVSSSDINDSSDGAEDVKNILLAERAQPQSGHQNRNLRYIHI